MVAPLAGSVDRNRDQNLCDPAMVNVAPLAGSVDRNTINQMRQAFALRRSPRGERG